ncbi:MAG: hypothetical protein U9O53_02255 [archaeon]|nr:hypothetical protein [archaeon]
MSDTAKEEKQSVRIRDERDDPNLIFESMLDGVYMVSKDRKLTFMNRVLREKFGDRVDAICYETFHRRRVPCPLCKLSEVLDGKIGSKIFLKIRKLSSRKYLQRMMITLV